MADRKVWKYGDSSAVPDDVKHAIGTTLGAAAFHPCIRTLLASVGTQIRRAEANARRRARRKEQGNG